MEFEGEFLGFTFNNIHSSNFNIVRISSGDRFVEGLTNSFTDQTAQINGHNGVYFFNTNRGTLQKEINFAFQGLTETNLRQLRQWLDGNKLGDLIFDENPYKVYPAKVATPVQLSYMVFEGSFEDTTSYYTKNNKIDKSGNVTGGGGRLYKGEGSISFICFKGMAHNPVGQKFLSDFGSTPIHGVSVSEWEDGSNMLEAATVSIGSTAYTIDSVASSFKVYNGGDVETDFQIYYPFNSNGVELVLYDINNLAKNYIRLNSFDAIGSDSYFCINSKSNLIVGCDSTYKETGNLYNKYIAEGDFFKIPPANFYTLKTTNGTPSSIFYHYWYY